MIFNFYYIAQQPEIYDRLDQAVLLRQEQLLKAQSAPHEGGSRYFYIDEIFNVQFSIEDGLYFIATLLHLYSFPRKYMAKVNLLILLGDSLLTAC